jgi:hypothetical protein
MPSSPWAHTWTTGDTESHTYHITFQKYYTDIGELCFHLEAEWATTRTTTRTIPTTTASARPSESEELYEKQGKQCIPFSLKLNYLTGTLIRAYRISMYDVYLFGLDGVGVFRFFICSERVVILGSFSERTAFLRYKASFREALKF